MRAFSCAKEQLVAASRSVRKGHDGRVDGNGGDMPVAPIQGERMATQARAKHPCGFSIIAPVQRDVGRAAAIPREKVNGARVIRRLPTPRVEDRMKVPLPSKMMKLYQKRGIMY